MTNPFEVIEARLIAIEALLIDLKQSPKEQAAPADVLPANMVIKQVSYARIEEIVSNPCVTENLGFYIAEVDQDRWVGLYNLRGTAIFEEFGSEAYALHWLNNPDDWDDE